jgi:F0F1-type ATP synthase assembly protein I
MTNSPHRSGSPHDENPWQAAGLVLGLGAELAVCVGLGWWLGTMYDDHNGTDYGYLVGVIVGLISGIGSAITLMRKYTRKRRT